MTDLTSWTNAVVGRYIDVDGRYGAQCVDLVNHWAKQFGDLPYSYGNGKDKAANMSRDYKGYGWTYVDGAQKARPGDIVSWDGTWGGGYGHTAVVLADNGDTLRVVSQNPGPAHITTSSKRGLIGYARPKMDAAPTATPKSYRVATQGLNIRTAPLRNGRLATRWGNPLPKGTPWYGTGRTEGTWVEGRTPWMLSTGQPAQWVNGYYLKEN